MKLTFSLLLLGALLFHSSCADKSEIVGPKEETTSINEVAEVPDVVEQITVTGSFKSVKGVMDELSCYTSNGGYIKTADGTIIKVSFKENEAVFSCDKITVTGYMTSKSIEANGSCPEGMIGFLRVQSYIVGETDY